MILGKSNKRMLIAQTTRERTFLAKIKKIKRVVLYGHRTLRAKEGERKTATRGTQDQRQSVGRERRNRSQAHHQVKERVGTGTGSTLSNNIAREVEKGGDIRQGASQTPWEEDDCIS